MTARPAAPIIEAMTEEHRARRRAPHLLERP